MIIGEDTGSRSTFMGYFAKLHQLTTICQVAVGGLIASGLALLVFLIRLMTADFGHLTEMAWPMLLTGVSAIAVVVSAKILEGAMAKAEAIRMGGGRSPA